MAKRALNPVTPAAADFSFLQKALPLLTGWLVLLVSVAFFTGTYDSAQVKLTLFQMGAVMLSALWGAKLLIARKNPFTRQTIPFFLPLLVYMGWQVFSFACFPYKIAAAEEFTRAILYTLLTLLVACEFTQDNVRTLTRFIVAAAWISFIYGLVQVAAIWFPPLDLMNWRGFFGNRIFSTHANPNFYGAFVVFSSCIIGAQYLVSRRKSLLVLLGLGLVTLAFTESKGAWLAYGLCAGLFAFAYTRAFGTKTAQKIIHLGAAAVLAGALAGAVVYGAKRFQSVSFRAYTWLSAFEMVQDSPVKGTGLGSFKVVYPAYRRPQIFYLENAHNNETQHAENEYLEQWAVGGTVGLALFLWLALFFAVLTWKNIHVPAVSAPEKERKCYLLGYGAAVTGLLIHAFVDVSIHFVSSGLLFAVFCGVLLALAQHRPAAEAPAEIPAKYPAALWVLKALALAACVACITYIFVLFSDMMATLTRTRFGDWVLAMAAWLTAFACAAGANYIYMRTIWLTRRAAVILILGLSLPFIAFAYRVFQANHYYSVGVALINLHTSESTEGALDYFTRAIRLNPFELEYRQYRASVLATLLQLNQTFAPARGDKNAPSNDYERALKDYRYVLEHNPNHALLHQSIAQLYYAMGVRYVQVAYQAHSAEEQLLYNRLSRENLENAKRALKMALDLDPVYSYTYEILASIALMEHDFTAAQHWLDLYRQGPAGVTEEAFLQTHRDNLSIERMQAQLDALRGQQVPPADGGAAHGVQKN